MSKYVGKIVTNQAPAGYSVFFDGTGDYLTTASNAAFAFGTGNFTVEAWVYPVQSQTGYRGFLSTFNGTDGVALETYNGFWTYYLTAGGAATITTTPVVINTWTHIALTRSGTTGRFFVNGVLASTATDSTNFGNSSVTLGTIGGPYVSGYEFNGYVSNARIIKGTALYTAAFTPPTQLLNITNTQLLTCNSPAIVDQSSNAFAITTNGNAAVSTFTPFTAYVPYNPALGASTPGVWTLDEAMQAAATRQWNMYDPYFQNTTLLLHGNAIGGTTWLTDASTNNFTVTPVGGARADTLSPFSTTTYPTSGSGYFNRSGSYLTLPSNTALSFGTGDFTVEGWFYIPSIPGLSTLYSIGQYDTDGLLFRYDYFQLGTTILTPSSFIPLNSWFHCAVTRAGTSLKIFINGSTVSTQTNSTNHSSVNGVYIATSTHAASTEQLLGYISNFRIVKGTAVYTSNFTPSTAPLTAITNTSLLTLQTSQATNNNTFLDSSSNNFTITRNGNTTQGAFSPFSQTGWSAFLNGTSKLRTTSFTPVNAGQDFTVEVWAFQTTQTPGGLQCIATPRSGAASWYFGIYLNNIFLYDESVGVFSGSAVTPNTWQHLAFSRQGTTHRLFINGVLVATATATAQAETGAALAIGSDNSSNDAIASPYYGYLSNLRVVIGTALYTTNFTPATTPLTAVANTAFLSFQSNRFVDNSSNNYTINVSAGTPSVQAFSPFYPTAAYTPQTIGGSGYFDGTGDSLEIADNTAFTLDGDFTIEGWLYPFSVADTDNFIGKWQPSNQEYLFWPESGVPKFYWAPNSAVTALLTSSVSIPTNAWTHLAVTRSGNSFTMWVNGVSRATATNSSAVTNTSSPVEIGRLSQYPPNYDYQGYMAGVRIVKGTAVYTAAFTPPTSPVTAITNTSLLLNFTNAGIVDSTAKNVLETVGNAQISTAQSKFGGSSMYFDGTGDYLSTIATPNLALGSGNFTIEAWVYANSLGSFNGIVSQWPDNGGSTNNSFVLESVGSNMEFYWSSGSTLYGPATLGTISTGTWTHYAICRSGNTLYPFKNGVLGTTVSITQTLNSPTSAVTVGGLVAGGGYWNGYIDDLRITKGIARYTGNFTPQTSQWQDQ